MGHNGKLTNFLGMHRDVTEEHRLQRGFAHQKALIETVLDTAPVVVAVMDPTGKVLLDNQEYKKLLGDETRRQADTAAQSDTKVGQIAANALPSGSSRSPSRR